jgi:hypothetical protein
VTRSRGRWVSEPYVPPAAPGVVAALRRELEKVGAELLEYPPEQSTHYPDGNIAVLVANVMDIHTLARAVAKVIVASGEPPLLRETVQPDASDNGEKANAGHI